MQQRRRRRPAGADLAAAPEDWTWIVDVNLWGVVHGLAAFLPLMVEADRGHVVNTASIAGLVPVPGGGNAPYAARSTPWSV